jgi:toxin-antitoxin system PIN domain toxin
VIAVDTNVLVYAHREDSAFHAAASAAIAGLAEGRGAWAIPWACLHEFLAIVTHPRIYAPPTATAAAVEQVDAWLESPSLEVIGENAAHWDALKQALLAGRVAGPLVHDARVAAICIAHGVRELWTADRDFSRFRGLTVRNPLI